MRLLILLTLLIPLSASAQYTPLVDLPFVGSGTADVGDYINGLYIASISIAAFLAVLKIVSGGVKYTMSDVITTKGDAKKDIKGALLGLLIVLAAVLILSTINTDLTKLDVFRNATISPNNGGSSSFSLSQGLNISQGNTQDDTTRQQICSQTGGCTSLICGNIKNWDPSLPGTQYKSVNDCQARCDLIGGKVLQMNQNNLTGLRKDCVVSNTTLNNLIQQNQTNNSNKDKCLDAGGAYVTDSRGNTCRTTATECSAAGGQFDSSITYQGYPNEGMCVLW